MSGHSKWSSIKHKKAITDQRRGKAFGKLLRAIEVAAREGGGSIDANMTLASAVQKAKEFSVPMGNIERAIKRGTGEIEGTRYEPATYEGFAPGGVAVLVEAMTDNRNRTGQEIRHTFTRLGGNLGDPGSVAWMFERKGVVMVNRDDGPEEDRLFEIIVETGADDLVLEGDQWQVTTSPATLAAVRSALEGEGIAIASAELAMQPQTTVRVEGGQARQVLALVEALDDLEDVQAVYSNFDIPDEVLAEVG
ncbi:MAG TPA: YebC/PmpR family DNA-binding transcriptional regulator [Actinomycetota bacterium]|jgi:YebC/PmpR family DNA-binding regulatory protein|nr:YebC/PmpR family DNA-binding transcriptional regulator [Actinomycetota bacterium]